MRRFIALIGAVLIVCGLSLYRQDCFIPERSGRIDYYGSEITALRCCEELFRERYDDLIVIYAYTPLREYYVDVHGERVNVMIAVRGNRISVGSPVLSGSY